VGHPNNGKWITKKGPPKLKADGRVSPGATP
jgi:hypothetical protein